MNLKATVTLAILVACTMLPGASALPSINTTPLPGPDPEEIVEVYASCEFNDAGFKCVVGPCMLETHYDEGPVYYNIYTLQFGVSAQYDDEKPHGQQWGPYTGVDLQC